MTSRTGAPRKDGVRADLTEPAVPILGAEPTISPLDLLESWDASGEDRRWWAVYTRSRREKDLIRRLLPHGVGFYLPLVPTRRKSSVGRIRVSHLPLFSNYVFLCGAADDRRRALETNCVSRILDVTEPQRLVTDLRRLRDLIQTGRPVTLEQSLQPGDRVRVRSGPLRGREGMLVERRGERRLVVAVNFLQQGASVLLDDCDVEPLS